MGQKERTLFKQKQQNAVLNFLIARERKPRASSDRFPCPWTLSGEFSAGQAN